MSVSRAAGDHAGPVRMGFGLAARSSPAVLAALLCATAASAQDRNFTTNYTNNAAYIGKVLSNTSTINNNLTWLGDIVANGFVINNNSGATWTGNIQSNNNPINNMVGGTWFGSVRNQNDVNNLGTWTGDVLFNSAKIENRLGATWTGGVYDNQHKLLNYGTWIGDVYAQPRTGELNSYGSWFGNVIGNDGTIYNDGVWTGDVVTNSYRIISNIYAVSTGRRWIGNVISNDGIVSNYLYSTWDGDVLDNLGSVRNYAIWNGDVTNRGGVDNRGGSLWTGDVVANQGTVLNFALATWVGNVRSQTGSGILTNSGVWRGDVAGNGGTINNQLGATWQGAVLDNAGSVSNSGTWTGDLTNRGTITNIGIWTGNVVNTGTVSAQNRLIANVDNRGALQLSGDLAISGMLTNSGRLQLTQTAGSQTLTVGSVRLAPSSSYEINVGATGATDRMVVSGVASLGGTVGVTASTTGGAYPSLAQPHTILTAASLDGVFSSVTIDLAFLAPRLTYDANTVYLVLQPNNVGFASIGTTANQRSVGTTVEALGAGQPLFDAVLWLTQAEAQNAFDQLSGEGFETAKSAAILNTVVIRDVVLSRIDEAFEALGDTGDAASGYAGEMSVAGTPSAETDLWGQFYGAAASLSGDGLASLQGRTGGMVMGVDSMLNDWRIGAMLQLGRSNSEIAARNTRISSTDYGLGFYAGTEWGNTRLSLGGTVTLGATTSTRSVSFPGFSDNLTASYGVATTQGFAELSHAFDLGIGTVTPFAGLAQVFHATSGFTETGGSAALTRAPSVIAATFTTLGVGVGKSFVVGSDMLLAVEGSMGWRHAFADAPTGSAALVGGAPFAVVGVPIARDAVQFSAALSLDVDATTNLGLRYDGEAGVGGQLHAVKASWAKQF